MIVTVFSAYFNGISEQIDFSGIFWVAESEFNVKVGADLQEGHVTQYFCNIKILLILILRKLIDISTIQSFLRFLNLNLM